MATKEYLQKLKDPRWQKLRLKIMQRDEFTCKLCKDKDSTLNVHHIKYNSCDPWDIGDEFLITYCETCHKIVEQTKKKLQNKVKVIRIIRFINFFPNLYFVHLDNDDIHLYSLTENKKLTWLSGFTGRVIRNFQNVFKQDFKIVEFYG